MIFTNATMLSGVAGAMVPLTLHLLGRARYKRVEWGAVMFLGSDNARQSRASRLKEMALLGVRMGIVALLAVALSRPVLTPIAGSLPNEPTSLVIILDRSPSMTLDENGPQPLEIARRAALAALASLHEGDEAAVLFAPEVVQPQQQSYPLFTTDLQSIATQLNNIRASPHRADVATALNTAGTLLQRAHTPNRQLVLVCDQQATSWRGITEGFAGSWRQSVRDQAGQLPHFVVIPVGSAEAGNVAVESMVPLSLPVIRDVGTDIEVRVRNYDTVPAIGLTLTISMPAAPGRDRELYRTTLNLAAGASAIVRTSVRFTTSGSQVITARIPRSGITFDDTLDSVVEVIDPIDVLLVSGDQREPSAGGFRSEADFARLALSPFSASTEDGADPARVQVVSSDNWPELDRTRQRVVILANVPRFTTRQVRQLEQYVYGGGGLLLAPGNLARIDDYNTQLWRDGAGVMPAELESPVSADGSQATSLQGLELSHPIFRFLQGHEDPLPTTTIGRYIPVRAPEGRARVIGRYASGKPFLVEGSYGRGRVLLMTTSLDMDWSTLPLSNFYLPFMQSAVCYLAAGMQPERNLAPGQPIVAMLENVADSRNIRLQVPGAPGDQPIDTVRLGDGYEARLTNTMTPGLYRIRRTRAEPRPVTFAVNVPRDESDMSPVLPERWDKLERALDFRRAEAEAPAIGAALAASRKHQELWPILLAGVLALALLELALTRFWSASEESQSAVVAGGIA